MKLIVQILGMLGCILFLNSCVSYKPSYRGDWQRLAQIEDPYYTVYLIGDAGNAPMEESTEVFDYLKEQLDGESKESAIVWLGDNIYPVGLAPDNNTYKAYHKQGKHRLMAQLRTMADYRGQKYFVPGNHDWYTFGRMGLRRQELLVDSFLLQTPNPNKQINFFLPDKGCGDPNSSSLTDGISLLTMDSHWFLNEKARSGDQSVCETKNPQEFLEKLQSEISKESENSLIIASHHPPYTYSRHGGHYAFKEHIFPLTQIKPWLYLPLPYIGSIFSKMRSRITPQDVNHPLYISYRNTLIESLQDERSAIIASGHEHTLQLIDLHNQYFLVSGAGTKNNKVRLGKGSKFAIGEKGYIKLVFKDSKNLVIQVIVPGQFKEYNNIAYEKEVTLK